MGPVGKAALVLKHLDISEYQTNMPGKAVEMTQKLGLLNSHGTPRFPSSWLQPGSASDMWGMNQWMEDPSAILLFISNKKL